MELSGRRVLVTGGTRGIGRATVRAFAAAGAHVVTCGRHDDEDAQSLARELKLSGGPHALVRADVTDEADLDRLAEECRGVLGGLDAVVNNVGVDGHAPLAELDEAEWYRVLDADATAAFLVVRAMLPLFDGGGAIVNIGASAATRGRPQAAHHSAAKAALLGLTRSLAKELGPRGIRVNTVAPGVIGEDGIPAPVAERVRAMTALGRLGAPQDVAAAVLFLAGDDARYITGSTLNVDGGM